MSPHSPRPADSKAELLRKRLYALALEKGPDAQLPTVRALCDVLATTRVTLNDVLDILEEQDILYRKQRQGIFVSPKIYHKAICILFDATLLTTTGVSPFWSMLWGLLVQEAQQRASQRDETYTFHMIMPTEPPTGPLPPDLLRRIESGRVHAVLSIGLTGPLNWVSELHIPCITFAGGGKDLWYVTQRSDVLIQLGVDALVEQGCRQIGFWLANWDDTQTTDIHHRTDAMHFRQALSTHNSIYNRDLVRMYQPLSRHASSVRTPLYQEQGYTLAMETFGRSDVARPDGLLIANDMLTDGALAAFQDLGIRVGQDLKIATHANIGSPILFARTRNLTVIAYDPADIISAMFFFLDTLLAGHTPEQRAISILPAIRRS